MYYGIRSIAICGCNLQNKPMGKAYNGFPRIANCTGLNTGVVTAISVGHGYRSMLYGKGIITAGFCFYRFNCVPAKGKCQNYFAILSDFQFAWLLIFRAKNEYAKYNSQQQ